MLALLLKPGRLTNEFIVGKRVTYVLPIRLYIFLSFVFFLMLSLGSGTRKEPTAIGSAETAAAGKSEPNGFNVTILGLNSAELQGLSNSQIDSAMDAEGIERTPFMKYMVTKVARIGTDGLSEFSHQLLKGVSYMMFVLMPIFALLVFVFFRKKVGYYIDCLVFSVHFHSFVFLLFTIYLLLHRLIGSGWLILVTLIALVVYCYSALRVVYRQTRWLAAIKTVAIGILYLLSIVVCFLLLVLVSIVIF